MSSAAHGRFEPSVMTWRSCPGYRRYEVSECGDLRFAIAGRTRRIGSRVSGSVNQDGYLCYSIHSDDGRKRAVAAHVLVATAFIGPRPSPAHEVAHNNGSRVACHFTNLRWATRRENHSDMQRHGTAAKGERNGRAKLTAEDVVAIRFEHRQIKLSRGARRVDELVKRYRLSHSTICRIVSGQDWSHIPLLPCDEYEIIQQDAA